MEQSFPISPQVLEAPKFGAGFGRRAGAQVVDLIIHNAMGFMVGFVAGLMIAVYAAVTGVSASALSAKLGGATLTGYILALSGYVAYHTICEGMHGATLGKLLFKVHVLGEDGNPASLVSALIRSVAFILDSFFLGVVAYSNMQKSERRQRLGDKWAKTVVVDRSAMNRYPRPSGWQFVLVFLVALAADGLFFALPLIIKLF